MPVLEPDVPADRWQLDRAARDLIRELAHRLPLAPLVVASEEPKARQTAEEVVSVRGGTLAIDRRVVETRRHHRWDPDFAALAGRFVAGERHEGWESQEDVVARFDAAVRESLLAAGQRPLVIVDHGQALTLWLHSVGAVADPAGFWEALTFPDAWTVSLRREAARLVATEAAVRIG
jgi:broad specificity phosphatase PhoE